jgi:hypothetical protein
MTKANCTLNPDPGQPGSWINSQGIPVDLMVPEAIASCPSRRRADIPPHARAATRRAVGLEAAVVDHAEKAVVERPDEAGMTVRSSPEGHAGVSLFASRSCLSREGGAAGLAAPASVMGPKRVIATGSGRRPVLLSRPESGPRVRTVGCGRGGRCG